MILDDMFGRRIVAEAEYLLAVADRLSSRVPYRRRSLLAPPGSGACPERFLS